MGGFEDTSHLMQGVPLADEALASIAISLKRIADALDKPTTLEREQLSNRRNSLDVQDAETMVAWLKGVRPEGTVR